MSFLSSSVGSARSVSVQLRADVSGYIASMRAAGLETKKALGSAVTVADKSKTELRSVGTAAGVMGAAAAVGIGAAIKSAATFESKLAQIKSLLPETQKAAVPALAAATKGFSQYGVSASEAADAEIELVKAGIKANDIIGGALAGTLTLAAAGQLDVAQATEIAASAMTQFNLQGKDVPHIADLLAAGADKALGSVGDLGYGLSQAGTTAHQMGISIEDTVGTLAAFAQAGLTGERGGTVFKQMLLQLAAPTKQASDLMKKYGVSLYDANGQMKSVPEIAGNLRDGFANATPAVRNNALAVIFGSRAIQGANILMQNGQKDIQGWINKVNDQGFAADQAGGKMDSLVGDTQKLGAAFSTFLTNLGEGGQGPMRELVQSLTGIVTAADALPAPVKSSGLALLALFAIVGGGVFALTRLIGAVSTTKKNMEALKISAAGASKYLTFANAGKAAALVGGLALEQSGLADQTGLSNTASLALMGTLAGPWGAAIGGGIGLVKDLAAVNNDAAAAMDRLNKVAKDTPFDFKARADAADQLIAAGKDLGKTDLSSPIAALSTATKGWSFALHGFHDEAADAVRAGESFRAETLALQQGIAEFGAAINRQQGLGAFSTNLEDITHTAETIVPALQDAGYSVKQIQDVLLTHKGWDEAVAVVRAYVKAQDSIPGRTAAVGAAVGDMGDKMLTATQKAEGLQKALDALLGPELGLSEATDAWITGVRHLSDDLAKHSRALLNNSDAAITNRAALRGRVDLLAQQLVAEAKGGASAERLTARYRGMRSALLTAADAAGLNVGAVKRLLTEFGLGPALIERLTKGLKGYNDETDKIPPKKNTDVTNTAPKAERDVKHYTSNGLGIIPDHVNTRADFDDGHAAAALAAYVAQLRAVQGYTVHTHLINTIEERHLNTSSAVDGSSRPGRAGGGPIAGPGGPRDDRAGLFALSDGEFVEQTAAVDYYGLAFMHALNDRRIPKHALGLAKGGPATFHVGGIPGLARGGRVGQAFTLEDLVRVITRLAPTRDLDDVSGALHRMRDEARDVTRAEHQLRDARERSRNQGRRLQQTENALERARGKEKVDKAEVGRIEERLRHQRYISKQADRDLTKAETDLSKQREQLSQATSNWKDLQQQLIEQARAIADTVIAQGAAFGGEATSLTARGLVAKGKSAITAAEQFEHAIKTLRHKHYNEAGIRELLAEGPTAQGVALATSLAASPQSLINQLNAQHRALVDLGGVIGTIGTHGRVATQRIGGHAQSVGAGGQIINNNFTGPVHGDPDKYARAVERRQRRAARRARQNA